METMKILQNKYPIFSLADDFLKATAKLIKLSKNLLSCGKNKLIMSVQCALAVFILSIPISGFSGEFDEFQLNIQNLVDYTVPLPRTTWPGTHNSYSAPAWGEDRPLFQNQYFIPSQQFLKGLRMVELDIHPTLQGVYYNPFMCHNSLGESAYCTIFNPSLETGIADMLGFLKKNRDAVLLVQFETFKSTLANSFFGDIRAILESKLKPYLFRPSNHANAHHTHNGRKCASLPVSLTKQDVLDAGKNIIITASKACNDYISMEGLGSFIWKDNLASSVKEPGSGCGGRLLDGRDETFDVAWDGTTVSNAPAWLKGGKLVKMMKCGYNVIEAALVAGEGHDAHNGPTIQDFNWMWAAGQPDNNGGNQDCAISGSSGKWSDKNCSNIHSFACSTSDGKDWKVTPSASKASWTHGEHRCSKYFGDDYAFAVPANAYENEKLIEAKTIASKSVVWVKFNDRNLEDFWQTTSKDQMKYEVHKAIGGSDGESFNHDHMVKRRYLMSNDFRIHKISFNSVSSENLVKGVLLCWATYSDVNNNVVPDSTSDTDYEHCLRVAGKQGDTTKSFTLAEGEKITEWKICAKERPQGDGKILVSYVRLKTNFGNRLKSDTHSNDADFCKSVTLSTPKYLVGAHGRSSSYVDKLGFSFGD